MCFNAVFVATTVSLQCSFRHNSPTDDKRRAAFFLVSSYKCFTDSVWIIAINLQHIPSPSTIFHASIFVHNHSTLSRKLNVISVIEHNKIVESQVSCQSSYLCTNTFLDTTVRDKGINLVLHHGMTKSCFKEFLSNCCTSSVGMALSKWTRRVLYAMCDISLWMTWCD